MDAVLARAGEQRPVADRRLALEVDLQAAVAEGQSSVVYQPVVELGSGRVTGVEALLRWRHPSRGVVAPVELVPLLEETGRS